MTNHVKYRITVTWAGAEGVGWQEAGMHADIRELVRAAGYDPDLTVKVEQEAVRWAEIHPNPETKP